MKVNPLATALKRLEACGEAIEWVRESGHDNLPAAWGACTRGDWMLWLLAALDPTRTDLEPLAWTFSERALKAATTALRSSASVHPASSHRESLEHYARTLDAFTIDSSHAARAASAAAGAASYAAGAASYATGAARAAAEAASYAAGAASDATGAARAAAEAASDTAGAASDAAWAASAAAGAARAAAGAASYAARAASYAAGAARAAAGAAENQWQADYIRAHVACPTLKGESE